MCKAERWFLAGLLFVIILTFTGWSDQVQSQEKKYPTRAIDIIVAAPPGGGTDLVARVTTPYLSKKWGVPVNVVNKPGGMQIPAAVELYNAAPDGYTMMYDSQSTVSLLGAMVKNLPFNIMDRSFVAVTCASPLVLVVPSVSPFKTIEDLLAEIKKNPGNISYPSMGGPSGFDYATRQLCSAIGVDILKMKAIVVTGGAPAVVLLAGGHVTFGHSTASSVMPAISAGTVRPMFITSKNRFPSLPNLPTSAEMGYPTVTSLAWSGITGPPKMPSYIVDIWNEALSEWAKDPEVISKLQNVAAFPFYIGKQEFRAYVTKEMEEASKLF